MCLVITYPANLHSNEFKHEWHNTERRTHGGTKGGLNPSSGCESDTNMRGFTLSDINGTYQNEGKSPK